MTLQPTFEGRTPERCLNVQTDNLPEIMGCQAALFEWAESYDSKDWDRLKQCIAPFLRVSFPVSSYIISADGTRSITEPS